MACQTPIIVALDFPTRDAALALADQLDPALCRVKVGKELFTRCGPHGLLAWQHSYSEKSLKFFQGFFYAETDHSFFSVQRFSEAGHRFFFFYISLLVFERKHYICSIVFDLCF